MPLTPNQERINALTTLVTFEISEMFLKEISLTKRQTKIINYLGKELAISRAKIEILTK